MNDEQNNLGLVIGMDVDQSALSPRVPFSMIIQTGQVLHDYLKDWLSGRDWPASRTLDMSHGAAQIMLHPSFYRHNTLMDYEYRDPDTFLNLYNRFIDEAVSKEQEYENN
jgi:basic membrane lipoprotein Med (substrate-binding protein (PBP1-ABC) superfamily)